MLFRSFGHFAVLQTADGGYIYSTGLGDDWGVVGKLNAAGFEQFQKKPLGSGSVHYFTSMRQTAGGDLLITGTNEALDGFILKLDAQGNVLWQKNDFSDAMNHLSIIQATDGGYALASSSTGFSNLSSSSEIGRAHV